MHLKTTTTSDKKKDWFLLVLTKTVFKDTDHNGSGDAVDVTSHNYELCIQNYELNPGGLAQLARALAWHARGHRFESDILHQSLVNKDRDL